jgi:hypothetical protein
MGRGIREEESGTTPQNDPSSLTGLENGFAFDASDADVFDFNFNAASALDATEIDIEQTLSLLCTEEASDYASLIDQSNGPGPEVFADNDQSRSSGAIDFFDMLHPPHNAPRIEIIQTRSIHAAGGAATYTIPNGLLVSAGRWNERLKKCYPCGLTTRGAYKSQ